MTVLQTLNGKQIVVAVTGSIAAVEVVRLIHALRRRGAAVQAVMSPAATGIVIPGCPDLCQWQGDDNPALRDGGACHVLRG